MSTPFTTVVAVDTAYEPQLRAAWPTWRRYRPEILEHPMILIVDAFGGPLPAWQERLQWLDHPNLKLVPWDWPSGCCGRQYGDRGISQRERMLTSLVQAAPHVVDTPWWLKLDCNAVAMRRDDWIPQEAMEREPAIISSPWSYTVPWTWLPTLDDWADEVDSLQRHPRLNLKPKTMPPHRDRLHHKRIISFVCWVNTSWSRRVSDFVGYGIQLPVPSQDTYHWYCATREKQEVVRINQKKRGWAHVSRLNSVKNLAREALEVTATPRPNPKIAGTKHHAVLARLLQEIQIDSPFEDLTAVEVGVYMGGASAAMLRLVPELVLTMIDPWMAEYEDAGSISSMSQEQFDHCHAAAVEATSFAEGRRRILPLSSKRASRLIADGSRAMVFLDGEHTKKALAEDLELWWPKVRGGGRIVGHDYGHRRFPGVKEAVDEWAKETGQEITVEKGGSTIWWTKKEKT